MVEEFLNSICWKNAQKIATMADGSSRIYTRLKKGNKTAILMDASAERESCKRFCEIGAFLDECDFSVPRVYEKDLVSGYLLLEDFGTKSLCSHPEDSDNDEHFIVASAVAVRVQGQSVSDKLHLPTVGNDSLLEEIKNFLKWYIEPRFGVVNDVSKAEFLGIWKNLLKSMPVNRGLALGDFHSGNLMWLGSRSGERRIGILDFQDAHMGNLYYDLFSLLNDVRKKVSSDLHHKIVDRSFRNIDEYYAVYPIISAQRLLRTLGIVSRLIETEKKLQFCDQINTLLYYLIETLKFDCMSEVSRWFHEECTVL